MRVMSKSREMRKIRMISHFKAIDILGHEAYVQLADLLAFDDMVNFQMGNFGAK